MNSLLTRAGENNPIHTGVLLDYQTETERKPKSLPGPGTAFKHKLVQKTQDSCARDCMVTDKLKSVCV